MISILRLKALLKKLSCMSSAVLIAAASVSPVYASDERYPPAAVTKISIVESSTGSVWEHKDLLDCSTVILTEEDVRYALRHMRRVSEKSFFSDETERTGCFGAASVTFRKGTIIVVGVEPTGRINIFEANAKLEPIGVPGSYYECAPCRKRKMSQLRGASTRK